MIEFAGAPAVRLIKRFPKEVKEKERRLIDEAISRLVFKRFFPMPENAIWQQGLEGFNHSLAFIPDKSGTFISRLVLFNEEGLVFDLTKGKPCKEKGSANQLCKNHLQAFLRSKIVQLPEEEEELQSLGLSLVERQRILSYVAAHLDEWGQLTRNHRVHRSVSGLANSLLVMPDYQGGVKKILMRADPDRVGWVGTGGQRAVEFAFDLTAGNLLATKKLIDCEIEMVSQLQGQKGICSVICLRKSGRLFAPLYEGTFSSLMDKHQLNILQKRKVMSQLLQGLVAIHRLKTSEGDPAFHSDIKPKNILFRFIHSRLVVVIDDFGLCNRRHSLAGTAKWISPEFAKMLMSADYSDEEAYALNRSHGQAMDVWAMGLVFSYLLTGSYLPDWAYTETGDSLTIYQKISSLDQLEVSYRLFIGSLNAGTKQERKMWEITLKMLQVDPNYRIDARSALQLLKNP
jgi:hypothetical protein